MTLISMQKPVASPHNKLIRVPSDQESNDYQSVPRTNNEVLMEGDAAAQNEGNLPVRALSAIRTFMRTLTSYKPFKKNDGDN